jgi:hypothetical protein
MREYEHEHDSTTELISNAAVVVVAGRTCARAWPRARGGYRSSSERAIEIVRCAGSEADRFGSSWSEAYSGITVRELGFTIVIF